MMKISVTSLIEAEVRGFPCFDLLPVLVYWRLIVFIDFVDELTISYIIIDDWNLFINEDGILVKLSSMFIISAKRKIYIYIWLKTHSDNK